jgi:DNA-binding transcriptional regulator LsrR (DeoR family)
MSRPPQKVDYRLMTKVAKLYYESGLRQREIAERLRLSRPKVSRILNQARDEGIVHISIVPRSSDYHVLESDLEDRFQLKEVVVVEVNQEDPQTIISEKIGLAAADYLSRTIQDGDVIGVSWGMTMNAMVNALQPTSAQNTQIVQLIGGLGAPEAEVHATSLCQRMAHLLGSHLTLIPTPGIVDSKEVRRILLSDRFVETAFKLFATINVAYVGIGAPTPDSVVMRDGSIISQGELNELKSLGAVGDIALRFFDAAGQPVRSSIDDRVIGITLEQLKKVERVVGATGGIQKLPVIYGALVGGWINILVTDQLTGNSLLNMHESGSQLEAPALIQE